MNCNINYEIDSIPYDNYVLQYELYLSQSNYIKEQIENIIWQCNDSQTYSIFIDVIDFTSFNFLLGNLLLSYPDRMISYLQQSITNFTEKAIQFYQHNPTDKSKLLKPNLRILPRFT